MVAPQFAEITADDDFRSSDAPHATVNSIKAQTGRYHTDPRRFYATGRSDGCMISIAMNLEHPTFFATSSLVAGRWDPAEVKPLEKTKLRI